LSPLARRVLVAVALGVLVYAGITVYTGARPLAAALAGWKWWLLAPALGLALANYFIRFLKWHYYLRVLGVAIPAGESLCVFLAGFVLTVTPGKLGEVVKSYLLRESRGVPMARTAPVVVAERLTDLAGLLVLSLVGLWSFPAREATTAAIVGVAAVALCLAVASSRRATVGLLRAASRLPLAGGLAARAETLHASIAALLRPVPLLWTTLLSAAAWFCECLGFWLVVGGFAGTQVSLHLATFIYAAMTIAGALSFLPGGLGVTEGGMILLLARAARGVGDSVAGAATFVTRLCTLWFAVVVGFVALLVHRRLTGVRLDDRALAKARANAT
jgi:uncharacterized membrane protein YbhN (UPF0104 family)